MAWVTNIKPDSVEVGQRYLMPSGIIREVEEFREDAPGFWTIFFRQINGKRPGVRLREGSIWFCENSGAQLIQ